MNRTLTASALALALTLGSFAAPAPAQAGDAQAARVVLGALTVLAIGSALANNRGQAKAPPPPAQIHRAPPPPQFQGRHEPRRDQRIIPSACLRDQRHERGRMVDARCMRGGRGIAALPDRCEISRDRSHRDLYDTNCLARYGWQVEGRRR